MSDDAEPSYALLLTLFELGYVTQGEELIRVFELYLRVSFHPAFHYLHLASAKRVVYRKKFFLLETGLHRACISVRASRKAYDRGLVAFLIASARDFQVFDRLERDIIRGVLARRAVRRGVDAVEREVAFVLWPLPIIYFASELGYALGRSRYEPDVGIGFIKGNVELHPAPHRVERSLKPRAGLVSGFHYVS